LAALTAQLAGRTLDADLDAWRHGQHGAGGASFQALQTACQQGVVAAWLACPPGSAHPPTVSGGRALVL
jgi:hypothetical protein